MDDDDHADPCGVRSRRTFDEWQDERDISPLTETPIRVLGPKVIEKRAWR